jgi:MFS family permease
VNILPGLVAIGFGLGLTFVSVSITAMADVREDIAGVASGLMTTGHETGAALGVAALSAVASAVAVSGQFASGYRAAQWAATLILAPLLLITLLVLPAIRPPAGTGSGCIDDSRDGVPGRTPPRSPAPGCRSF